MDLYQNFTSRVRDVRALFIQGNNNVANSFSTDRLLIQGSNNRLTVCSYSLMRDRQMLTYIVNFSSMLIIGNGRFKIKPWEVIVLKFEVFSDRKERDTRKKKFSLFTDAFC